MESAVEEVKKKIDIIDFLNHYITLKKAGRNFKANCPFHQEKTPSFVISPERQIWHCFGSCGDGGDIFKFLMKWENITFSEALNDLAKKAGVTITRTSFADNEWEKKQRYLRINTLAAEFFEYLLQKSDIGNKARDYLLARDINMSLAQKFQLGYAPSSWDSLLSFMKKKHFFESELTELGLMVKNANGRCYDRFRGRLMFPIKDVRGGVVGFSGRTLSAESSDGAKYINTPETPLYHKRETLFGIHLAKEAIKKTGNALVVEGEFDMITPYKHGVENVVAIKGSSVTREQLLLLRRYTSRITLALDTDVAGEEAIRRAIEEADETDMEITVVQFENAKDPDEAAKKDLVNFKKQLEKPLLIYDFVIALSQKKYPNQDAYSKKKIGDETIPLISRIKNPIIQSFYTKKIAALLGVSDESILETIKKQRFLYKPRGRFTVKKNNPTPIERAEIIQKYLLSVIFQSESPYLIADKVFALIKIEDFTVPALQKIWQAFGDYQKNNPQRFNLSEFAAQLPSPLKPAFDEAYLFSSTDIQLDSNIDRLILDVKKSTLKKKISFLLQDSESSEHEGELLQLTQALKEVEKQAANV